MNIKSKVFLSVMLFGSYVNLCASSTKQGDGCTSRPSDPLARVLAAKQRCVDKIYGSFHCTNDPHGSFWYVGAYFTDKGVSLRGLESVAFDGKTYYRERTTNVNSSAELAQAIVNSSAQSATNARVKNKTKSGCCSVM